MKRIVLFVVLSAVVLSGCYPPIPTTPLVAEKVPTPAAIMSRDKFTANYSLLEERMVDKYVLRLWHDGASSLPFDSVATVAAVGQPEVRVDYASGFDELTGKDILGEGRPAVIIRIHKSQEDCCYGVVVLDLGPTMKTVLDVREDVCQGRFKDLNADGIYEYIGCGKPFSQADCPTKDVPAGTVIYQYRHGQGFSPADSDFVAQYATGILQCTPESPLPNSATSQP